MRFVHLDESMFAYWVESLHMGSHHRFDQNVQVVEVRVLERTTECLLSWTTVCLIPLKVDKWSTRLYDQDPNKVLKHCILQRGGSEIICKVGYF